MSDKSSSPPDPPHHHGAHANHWSIRKIVEDVTGKKIEDFQDPRFEQVKVERRALRSPEATASVEDEKEEVPSEPLTSFLPQPKKAPLFSTLPPEMLENVPFPFTADKTPGGKGSNAKQLERLYLAYLMLHMGGLTEPALRYLRDAVEEECRDRGMMQ